MEKPPLSQPNVTHKRTNEYDGTGRTPASQQPASQQPTSQQPASQQLASRQPAYQQPTSQQPAPQQPRATASAGGFAASPRLRIPRFQQPTFQQPRARGWGSASTSPAFKTSLAVQVAMRAGKATPVLFTVKIASALSGAARAAGPVCALATLTLSARTLAWTQGVLLLLSSGREGGLVDRKRLLQFLSTMLGSMDGMSSDQK